MPNLDIDTLYAMLERDDLTAKFPAYSRSNDYTCNVIEKEPSPQAASTIIHWEHQVDRGQDIWQSPKVSLRIHGSIWS